MQEHAKIIHNSQMSGFRNIFGAVKANSELKISIHIPEIYKPTNVILRLWQDNTGETLVKMRKADILGDDLKFQCTIAMPSKGCLLWYYFVIVNTEKTIFYGNNAQNLGGEGAVYEQQPPSFQITVYNEDAKTPDWFKSSVMYQIFPDRFYNGHKDGFVHTYKKNAVVHASWENAPCYFKDPDTKEILAYDFFGGNIAGIKAKLPYLKELGINVIYLNPIFKAESNHRYDTGDYHQIDPMLGTNEEFGDFCSYARSEGFRIILDGVFSHTGSNSKYFNRYGEYDSLGAYQSSDSPYYGWYNFHKHPNEYESWWGFETLPNVKETTPSYMDFIISNKESVLHFWLNKGISGWRLDVVDELPPDFVQTFYRELKKTDAEAVLIGEVWEDASNKVSYNVSREYLCGQEIDSAMNYPFRKILLDFFLGYADADQTNRLLMSLYENYPKHNFYAMMNLIGSHDVQRVLTLLGEAPYYDGMPAVKQARYRLDKSQYQLAVKRLKMISLWQMTFPGVPTIYYGDEVGMQGFKDPHNRAPYPWGREDKDIQSWYKKIISVRNKNQVLKTGEWIPVISQEHVYGYVRRVLGGKDVFGAPCEDATFVILFNRSKEKQIIKVNVRGLCQGKLADVLENKDIVRVRDGKIEVELAPLSGAIYKQIAETKLGRGCGVLMHPTSLPSKYGIGDLGKGAYEFINFLVKAKQHLWQILPLNPVGYGASPYQSSSAFAGNPMLISLGKLVGEGLLMVNEVKPPTYLNKDKVDFEAVWEFKESRLKIAFNRVKSDIEFENFCKKHVCWLEDYALFSALKEHFSGEEWNAWPLPVRKRLPKELEKYKKLLGREISYHKFLQFVFFKQWASIKFYAKQHGVQIIGDMPIFIAHDSADVWANQHLFALDEEGKPEKVAGVPPDYFSETGQLWGNPHYHWEEMAKDDYTWWRNRFKIILELVDIIRVDHFRGFEAYWQVDGNAKTAIDGKWVKGPGRKFFITLEKYFGKLPIIAEDLGIITDDVIDLKDEFALPGMKVLHFELLPDEEGKIGFICEQNCIVYTGTHDNNTTVGWYKEDLAKKVQIAIGEYLNTDTNDPIELCWALIRYAYGTNACVAMIPMQDLLSLDSDARMNMPGTCGQNWQWRAKKKDFNDALAATVAELVEKYHR
ncbi:4-alpha-glucanotransferase [Anaerosinus sp.]